MAGSAPLTAAFSFPDAIRALKKCVVFLGRLGPEGRPEWRATGFLIHVSGAIYLVTAKHAIVNTDTGEPTDEGLLAWYNLKPGGAFPRSLDDLKKQGYGWLFPEDSEVDLAMMPFAIIPATDDLVVIPEAMFAATDQLFETLDLLYVAYQPGTENPTKVSPVIRTGMLSRINDDGTYLLDGTAFPGNSGCPVFVKPSATRFGPQGITVGGDTLAFRFVGVIGSYIPYRDVAVSQQTGRARIEFEENTGLSQVWSVDHLRAITNSPSFKQQVERMKQAAENQS
jgi:hypothetical protein